MLIKIVLHFKKWMMELPLNLQSLKAPENCCYQEQPGLRFLEMQVLESSAWIWENFFKPLNLLGVTEFTCQRGKQPTYVCVSCCFSRNCHELCNIISAYDACLSTGNCCLSRIFVHQQRILLCIPLPFFNQRQELARSKVREKSLNTLEMWKPS